MEIKNLLSPQTQKAFSWAYEGIKKKVKPLTDIWTDLYRQNVEAIQPAVSQVKDVVSTWIVEPIMKPIEKVNKISKVNQFLASKGITVDDIKNLAEADWSDPEEALQFFRDNGIKIEGMESMEDMQAKQAEQIQSQDISKNAWARTGVIQNVGWALQDVVGGAISEVPNAIWNTASFLNTASQYNPASYVGGIVWDVVRAPFSDKSFWEIRDERSKAKESMSNSIRWIWKKWKEIVQKYWAYDPGSIASKIWETGVDIASSFIWPNKVWVFQKWKTALNAGKIALEWGLAGAKYDIASKWEVTPTSVLWWAWVNLWFAGIWKIVKAGVEKLPASLTLGGLINPAKLDIVKKSLQVDEWVATPEDVGKWILNRVKPWNKQEIAEQLIQHAEKTKWAVDETLATIKWTYKSPVAKKALLQLRNDIEWISGLEWKVKELDNMLAKWEYTLSDLNWIKRELDNTYNIYTKSWDPTSSLKAEWLRNIRSDLRRFIEKEADKFGVNVRKLNNETSVARWLADGIMRKDSADWVRELLTAFAPSGAGGVIGWGAAVARWEDPLTILRDTVIWAIWTKIATSTLIRTKIASAINNLWTKELSALEMYIRSGWKDVVGKKVAEDILKNVKLLPKNTLTKPVQTPIITPQTAEKWIIQESKKWLSSNVNRPLSPQKKEAQKLLPSPRIPAWTSLPRTDLSAESMQGLSSNVKRPNGNTNNTSIIPSNIPIRPSKVQKVSKKVEWIPKKK